MTRLQLDLVAPSLPVNPVWSFGASACRASLLQRKDVQRHLLMGRDEAGLKHVHCHGMLAADMEIARADGSYDFTKVEQTLDMLLENGLVPFIELTGLTPMLAPDALTSPGTFAAGPPKDWGKWQALVRAFAQDLDGRYGCDVEQWYFEVGSQPDLFWTGTRAEYFKLYDLAAAAIKSVHPAYRVGGPATSNLEWIAAFLQHIVTPSDDFSAYGARCDFITTSVSADDTAAGLAEVRAKVTAALGSNIPIVCAGANAPLSYSHDACPRAAAICQSMLDLADRGVSQGMIWRNLSDISDERGWHYEPFHGGSGLITVNDIRKAAFHAFRMLNDHASYHSQRVKAQWADPIDGVGCLATRNETTLRLLLWYHGAQGTALPTVQFPIDGLPDSVRYAQVEVIRRGAGSAYEAWLEMDRPQFVNREVLDALEAASHPANAEVDFRHYPPRLEPGMVMQLVISLPFDEQTA